VEGNKHRDIWKKVAWGLTKDKQMPQMERTIYAALCANLEQLRSVCTLWEDKLWAGAKCAVDVLVETEIRSQIIKNFAELPTEYWNSPTSLSKVSFYHNFY
jgi:nuclear pore complex protein Nup107